MCDLNRDSGSKSLQMVMTGSVTVKGVQGKETMAAMADGWVCPLISQLAARWVKRFRKSQLLA